jgi:branched-chain amino acid transport system permease protein
MDVLIQQILNGATIGIIYALVALGLTLVYGVLRILHFAHGATYAIGAYVALAVATAGGGLLLAVIAAALAAAVAGWLIERMAYRYLVNANPIAPLIVGLGIYLVIQDVLRLVGGPYTMAMPVQSPLPAMSFAGFMLTGSQLLIIVVGLGLMALTQLLLARTRLGLQMRAVASRRDIAAAVGINVNQVVGATFLAGSAIAGVAGVLVALAFNAVYPSMGLEVILKSFAVGVVGGLGSVTGALVTALFLGISEALIDGYLALPIGKDEAAFVLLVIVLLLRPQGLFGRSVDRA